MHVPSLGNVKPGGDGRYLPAGEFVVRIDKVKLFENRKRKPRFGLEFTIEESDQPGVKEGESNWSIVHALDDDYDYGLRDMKTFICMAVDALRPGTDAMENWDDAFLGEIAEDTTTKAKTPHPQPCKGMRVSISAYDKPTERSKVTKYSMRVESLPDDAGGEEDLMAKFAR